MSSSTPDRPAAPARPSAAVYRRRRVLAVLLLLLVVATVGWGVTTLLAGGEDADAAPDAPATTAPAEDVTADGAVTACAATDLEADLVLDPAPKGARIEVTLRNAGDLPCLVDAGPAALETTVSSGSDLVWTSAHCADGETDDRLLDAGARTSVVVPWDGHRSAEGCPADQPQAGAGTYRVALALAGERLDPPGRPVLTLR